VCYAHGSIGKKARLAALAKGRGLTRGTISYDDDAVRTIVDLPEEQIKALDAYRRRHGISRAEAVRRAVAAFVPRKAPKKIDFRRHPAFGSSKTFRREDSVELVRRLREEWR
jgi:Ribbon-helix-helix protein, copG family